MTDRIAPRAWIGIALLVAAAAVFGRTEHPHTWWEKIPAYGALFGYLGTYALVFLAKSILAPRIRREGVSEE